MKSPKFSSKKLKSPNYPKNNFSKRVATLKLAGVIFGITQKPLYITPSDLVR